MVLKFGKHRWFWSMRVAKDYISEKKQNP